MMTYPIYIRRFRYFRKNSRCFISKSTGKYIDKPLPEVWDTTKYNIISWINRLNILTHDSTTILIVHDYKDKIGWAEYAIEKIETSLIEMGKK